jgi:hypothetical protein
MSDLTGLLREGSWILGSVAAATAFCYVAPEYGYSPVLFISLTLYLSIWILRFTFRWLRSANSAKSQ